MRSGGSAAQPSGSDQPPDRTAGLALLLPTGRSAVHRLFGIVMSSPGELKPAWSTASVKLPSPEELAGIHHRVLVRRRAQTCWKVRLVCSALVASFCAVGKHCCCPIHQRDECLASPPYPGLQIRVLGTTYHLEISHIAPATTCPCRFCVELWRQGRLQQLRPYFGICSSRASVRISPSFGLWLVG